MKIHKDARPLPLLPFSILVALAFAGIEAAERPPNIIFILADDLGWGELGAYGNRFNETPHLDRLAAEGVRFTYAYAAAPVCSPYRASFLTGQYPARHGILDYLRPSAADNLDPSHVTVAEMLKGRGYATGMIGKWHLTGYRHNGATEEVRATDHGFDEELVTEVSSVGNGANFFPYVYRTQSRPWLSVTRQRLPGREYLVDRMNLEAVDFIARHKDEPFFLYLSHFATHTILHGKEELVARFRRKHAPPESTRPRCYICRDAGLEGDPRNHWAPHHNPHLAAMLASIDDGVGMILDKLEALDLRRRTLIVFTSDNGGEHNVTVNAQLRGAKSQLYEGGIRVPLLVSFPGVVPRGKVCATPTVNVDFYPTFLEAAGVLPDPAQKLDGVSVWALFKDPAASLARDTFYWHYPLEKPHFLGGRSSGAIRRGDLKLIEFFESGEVALFDVVADPSEANDLAPTRPTEATELRADLARWRRRTIAH